MDSASDTRWAEIERLLDEALELAPEQRSGFLAQTHSGDPALAVEVERLLRAIEDSGDLLAGSGLAFAAPLVLRVAEHGKLVPGQRFENYEVVRELGHGGMATVYLAQDLRHSRQVALKVLRPELSANYGADRFAREIGIAAQLNHPHILALHDSGSFDLGLGEPALFYAMPYVDGRSLRDRLREEPQLPLPEALRIARQVADALEYAHRQGVIHRDIKPANILLTNDHAIVADFGIARALDRAATEAVTQAGLTLGTPAYMSPEQAEGTHLDGRSDVYSLGCVVYEMLAGHPPFAGTTAQVVLARHAVDPVPPLRTVRRTVPIAVEQAIMRALAKIPADRFATARDFADALATSEPPLETYLEPPPRSPAPPHRRHAAFAVLGALAVTTLIVLGVSRIWRTRESMAALDPRRVLVAPFANNTGDAALATLGTVAADRVASGLVEIQQVQMVDAGAVPGAEGRAPAIPGSGDARARAQRLGAGTVLWGSYYRRGDSIEFQAQVTDTRSGRIVAPIRAAAAPATDPTAAIELLRQYAMAAVAWHFDPEMAELEHSSRPSSYEAYREFIAGNELVGAPGTTCRFAECDFVHWRRAYALDSTFTLPVIELARQGDLRFGGCELTDSIAEALRTRHDRLPALDRARLDAVVAGCHGQRGLQLQAARAALAAAPKSVGDATYLSDQLQSAGFLRAAVAIIERLDPPPHNLHLTSPAYHLLGEYDKELAAGNAAHLTDPDDLWIISVQARAHVGLGQLAAMEQNLDSALRVPTNVENEPWTRVGMLGWIGWELEAHGYAAEARAMYERALARYRSSSQEEQKGAQDAYAALLYSAGHWAEARAAFQHLIAADSNAARDPEIWYRGAQSWLGGIAAHLGDQREMDRVDRWLAAQQGNPYSSCVPSDRARMPAIRGEREQAMALLRLAVDQGCPVVQGLNFHSDPDYKLLWGYPPFEDFRKPKESTGGN